MQFFSFTIKKDLSKTKNKIKGKNLLVFATYYLGWSHEHLALISDGTNKLYISNYFLTIIFSFEALTIQTLTSLTEHT
jgi:hypothetical protein